MAMAAVASTTASSLKCRVLLARASRASHGGGGGRDPSPTAAAAAAALSTASTWIRCASHLYIAWPRTCVTAVWPVKQFARPCKAAQATPQMASRTVAWRVVGADGVRGRAAGEAAEGGRWEDGGGSGVLKPVSEGNRPLCAPPPPPPSGPASEEASVARFPAGPGAAASVIPAAVLLRLGNVVTHTAPGVPQMGLFDAAREPACGPEGEAPPVADLGLCGALGGCGAAWLLLRPAAAGCGAAVACSPPSGGSGAERSSPGDSTASASQQRARTETKVSAAVQAIVSSPPAPPGCPGAPEGPCPAAADDAAAAAASRAVSAVASLSSSCMALMQTEAASDAAASASRVSPLKRAETTEAAASLQKSCVTQSCARRGENGTTQGR